MTEIARAQIDPYGNQIKIGDITLRTPGLSGTAIVKIPDQKSTRSEFLESKLLDDAFNAININLDQMIEIIDIEPVSVGKNVSSRSTNAGEAAFEIQVPGPGDAFGQMLLSTDENGVATWHFPVDDLGQQRLTRSDNTFTYLIPARLSDKKPAADSRGLFGWLGKKIIRVLSFALVDPIAGKIGKYFVKNWEDKKRAHELRSFTLENYQKPLAPDLTDEHLARLAEGPALLFVHGTFSRAHSAFCSLSGSVMRELHNRYDGRVFAFNHPTATTDPIGNAQWLIDALPQNISLDLDIVCHSRGGLVSRILSEHQNKLSLKGRNIKVQQIVFVATPNNGTKLTDPRHMSEMIDTYTNALSALPDNLATDILEVLITVVKQISAAVLDDLIGLQAMNPDSDFMSQLNQSQSNHGAVYRALAANYEPDNEGLKMFIADRLMDRVFFENNDLVVPTEGVYAKNGSSCFPIKDAHLFSEEEGVQHMSFFGKAGVDNYLLQWLQARTASPVE